MGQSQRYGEGPTDSKLERALARIPPTTLPPHAYGPSGIEWAPRDARPSVFAWISWPHTVAQRVPAVAVGWNDRVVIVEFEGAGGTVSTVVWRNAVRRRR